MLRPQNGPGNHIGALAQRQYGPIVFTCFKSTDQLLMACEVHKWFPEIIFFPTTLRLL